MNVTSKIFLSYLLIVVAGWLLLCLPLAHTSETDWIDNAFIATSALSTTGLTTVNIATHYTLWGQAIILLLIQIGGIGYMTLGTMAALAIHHHFSNDEHNLIQNDLNLPNKYGFRHIVRIKIWLTLIIESVGAIFLYVLFCQEQIHHAVWQSIFHSVSAFCTSGMSLFPNNLENFNTNYPIQAVVIGLSVIGSLGFIVFSDIYRMIRHKQRKLTITSKIILTTTTVVVVLGTTLLFFTENALAGHSAKDRFWLSLFHSLSAISTAGFNTVPLDDFFPASLFLIGILMIIGASPTGTGGGLKSTTVAIVFGKMISTFRHKNRVVLFGNETPEFRVNLAMSSAVIYFAILYLGIFLLLYVENKSFMSLFFEAVSAIGTVGLSTGITGTLTNFGKIIIICLMFIGRITPLAIGIMLFDRLADEKILSKEDVSL